jgi:hypothetical protein
MTRKEFRPRHGVRQPHGVRIRATFVVTGHVVPYGRWRRQHSACFLHRDISVGHAEHHSRLGDNACQAKDNTREGETSRARRVFEFGRNETVTSVGYLIGSARHLPTWDLPSPCLLHSILSHPHHFKARESQLGFRQLLPREGESRAYCRHRKGKYEQQMNRILPEELQHTYLPTTPSRYLTP